MIRTRTAAALAAILAGGLVLASCGSSGDPLDNSNEPGPSASSPADAGDDATSGDDAMSGEDTSADEDTSAVEEPPADSDTPDSDDASTEEDSDTGEAGEPIVIGSANFTESELVAEIYAAALKAAGMDASTHLDIGSREVYLQAIEDGSINLLPEYTGGLLAAYDSDSAANAPDDVYSDLQKALPDALQVLDFSPAQDQDSVTVTKETADKYSLESIGDLADVAGDMTLGGSSEWQTRADGPDGMKKLYGVEFKDYKVLDPGGPLSVKGLTTGLVQVTDIFTTNPAIEENNFVVLKDPENLFLAQNVVPLVAKTVVTPEVTETLNTVSEKLTTEALTTMLKDINDTKADPADVATKWVDDNGLS